MYFSKNLLYFLLFLLFSTNIQANTDPDPNGEIDLENLELSEELQNMIAYYSYMDSIEQTFEFERGLISLLNGKIQINVPEGYKYLNGKDSEMILIDLWGNIPSEEGDKSIGMLIPDTMKAVMPDYSINITYSDEGHIKDKEAKKLDYDEMLEQMLEASLIEDE
jgi:uncharacterized membrane-anchored protein